jgi:DNA primase
MTDPHATDGANLAATRAALATAFGLLTAAPRRAAALTYLRQHGIPTEAIPPSWPLGYAPPGWTRITDTLHAAGFSDTSLLAAGLSRRGSHGTLIDTFRDRVLFPVHDHDGRLTGFLGRDLSGAPGAPKYLNTGQTALYRKGNLLYGLHEGHRHHPDADLPVLVEGPLDVLAVTAHATLAGRDHLIPIAACGTAVTDYQAALIADITTRRGNPAIIAMDSDSAGQTAALAAGTRLRRVGIDSRIAALPKGTDPADYLAAGGDIDAFTPDRALPLLTVQVQHCIDAQGDRMQWIEGRLAAAHAISRHLVDYPTAHVADQVGWIAHALDLNASSVVAALAAAYREAGRNPSRRVAEHPSPVSVLAPRGCPRPTVASIV